MYKLQKIIMFLAVFLSVMVVSCTSELVSKSKAANSPLETVRLLVAENEQFTTPRTTGAMSYPDEFKTIFERGYVIFAMHSQDQKPFFYKDEQTGELVGLDVEIGYAVANRLGVKAVFKREATSFDEVVIQVTRGEADIALSKLSLTMRRAELARFSNPYITFRQALLVNRLEYAKIGLEEQLPQFIKNYNGTIGVIRNSSYQNYAVANFPNAQLQTFDNWEQALDALFSGSLLAVYRDEGEVLIANATRKDASILMKPVFISDKRDPIAMAVSADAPLLQSWLNVFLDDYMLQNSAELTPRRLIERHFEKE